MTKTQLKKIAGDLNVAEYASYRNWMRALYNKAKEADQSYSYVKLSLDLGLASTNAHTIINGKRGLTLKTVQRVIDALGLTGSNKRCLETFVKIERAKTSAERYQHYDDLLRFQSKSIENQEARKQFEFFRDWYNAAILELLRIPDASDDLEWIASTLNPKVSLPKVKQSIELMKDLGYIEMREGRLRPTGKTITAGEGARSMALMSFHHQMIDLAKVALDEVPAKEREISALTLSVPSSMKEHIRKEILKLKKELLDLSENTQDELEEIVQVNFQMFGLGRASGETK